MIWHSSAADDIINALSVDIKTGLSNGEAEQRLEEYGPNTTAENDRPTLFQRFLAQLNNKITIALIIVAVISFAVTLIYRDNNLISPILIIAMVFINALIGAFHLYSSDHAKNALTGVVSPKAAVFRDGGIRKIPSEQLVPGDILILSEGDYITADARIFEAAEFRCNEAPLTGEAVPVEKRPDAVFEDITPAEGRSNMVFSGCTVVHGSARAVVVATGLSTELGHNAVISRQVGDDVLPLQTTLDKTSHIVNTVILICCALFFIIGMIRNFRDTGHFASTTVHMLLSSAALAVAAIPESLPAISTIVISIGIERIVRDRIIIKKTRAVELLGRTTVICADKTGILTHNSMHISKIYDGKRLLDIENEKPDERDLLILQLAASCSTLTNDATESAINNGCLQYAAMSENDLANHFPRLNQIPFDPERKTMATINMIGGKPFAIVKGAAEILAEKCVGCDSEAIIRCNDEMAQDAMRIVCIAMKPLDEIPANPNPEIIERDLIFVGLIGLSDPPRSESIKALSVCERAGIRTVMITGDHPLTAAAVARRIGILRDGTELLCGSELEKMSDGELEEKIDRCSVFARITPADKTRIVKAWQARGETVAITGDGIEDADALTAADVGCAIGKRGTDVARGCADIIIANDSFRSVVSAVKESRGLYENIRKSVAYLFSSNFGELLMFLIAIMFSGAGIAPLTAVQLLWLNLLTDSAPAISLSFEKAESSVMTHRPIGIAGRIFDLKSVISIAIEAVFIAAMSLIAFFTGNGEKAAITSCFATASLIQIFHVFNIRTSGSVFKSLKNVYRDNRFLVISSLCVFAIVTLFVLTPVGGLFGLGILSFKRFLICLCLSAAVIPFCEIEKCVSRRVFR